MKFKDTFSLAYRTVSGNKLRSGITIAIIAFGIMALIGIITAIEAMDQKFSESFSSMGANGFTIRYREANIRFGGGGGTELKKSKKGERKEKKSNLGKIITIDQAERFVQNYKFPALVSLSFNGSRNGTVTGNGKKTNPNVFITGGDQNYLTLNAYEVEFGRDLSEADVKGARQVCVLGSSLATKLYGNRRDKALDQMIRVNGQAFRVIGVLKSKGATFGFDRDNLMVAGYKNVHRIFFNGRNSFSIAIKVNNLAQIEQAMGEAQGLFRTIRKLQITEAENFVIDKSDALASKAMNSVRYLTTAAVVIGLITLIGAAIGLMNIMLVAVTERTKEVGLIKAIGGKQFTIRRQFLFESILISMLGAVFGILFGILVGNLFTLVLGTGFVIPWGWIVTGIVICSLVGLGAGIYPAIKASKLNPIDALRYE